MENYFNIVETRGLRLGPKAMKGMSPRDPRVDKGGVVIAVSHSGMGLGMFMPPRSILLAIT